MASAAAQRSPQQPLTAHKPARRKFRDLWQMPLLLLSIGLFVYAAYLFVDPKPGLSVARRIEVARTYLTRGRPDAAADQLNKLLTSEKLQRETEARVRLLLAEALEAAQKQLRIDLDVNHERIVEQTRIALAQGVKPEAEIYRRLGDSYRALNKPVEALENYRRAIAMDAGRALGLQRKVIELQLSQPDTAPAEASIDEYLQQDGLTDAERGWATVRKAELLVNKSAYHEARALLREASRFDSDPVAQGQVNYALGYCAWKVHDLDEAERLLRVARDQLKTQHPLDADAAYALGKIRQERGAAKEAVSFFQGVIENHPESAVAPLARLGRGVCRILLGQDDAGLSDLHELVAEIGAKRARQRYKGDTLAGLRDSSGVLAGRGNFQGSLELMAYEQSLEPEPAPDFYARLASVYERRAEQVEQTLPQSSSAGEKIRRGSQVRDLRTKAGDAYVAYSRSVTLEHDEAHGEALWKGVDLYDRAGNLQNAISALELFVAERPNDGTAPEALLRLGKSYQAAGLFDKAINSYQRAQSRYPQSLAASKSGVPLAQAYIAKGPQAYPSAEAALLRVVEDNPLITPEAQEFHDALFELAQLYYRTDRFEEAVTRLKELTDRYPQDEQRGQVLFMTADSYRKSAGLLNVAVSSAGAPEAKLVSANPRDAAQQAEAVAQKRDRLGKARDLYEQVINLHRDQQPAKDIDRLHLKLAHFYRADCVFDLGKYDEAIKLYDAAALKYQEDPASLAAYVQIVNSYCALGKFDEARTANTRATWLLRKMPQENFASGSFPMPKAYWERWLKWTSESGLLAAGDTGGH